MTNAAPHMKSPITPPKGARDGQLIDGASLPVRLANFVKLPHTVFAMPFALVGVLIASTIAPISGRVIAYVILAFTAARFAAMGMGFGSAYRKSEGAMSVREPRARKSSRSASACGM